MKKVSYFFLPVLILALLGSCDFFSNTISYENLQATNDALKIQLTVQSSILATQNAQTNKVVEPPSMSSPSAQSITSSPTPYPFVTNNTPLPPLAPISKNNIDHLVKVAELGTGIPVSAFWSPDGKEFAIVTVAGIYKYDAKTFKEIAFFRLPIERSFNRIGNTLFSPDGQYIALSTAFDQDRSRKNVIDLYSSQTGQLISSFFDVDIHGGLNSNYIAFSPKNDVIAVLEKTEVSVWDLDTKSLVARLETDSSGYGATTGMQFSPNGAMLSASIRLNDGGFTLITWDASNWSKMYDLRSFDNPSYFRSYVVGPFSFSPDSKYIFLDVPAIGLTIRDAFTGEHLGYISTETQLGAGTSIGDIDVNSAGEIAVSIQDANNYSPDIIKVWSSTGSQIMEFRLDGIGNDFTIQSIDFSPDGEKLLLLSNDTTIRVLDVRTKTIISSIQFYNSYTASFSPSENLLLTHPIYYLHGGTYNNLFWAWDVGLGSPIPIYFENFTGVGKLVYSPDGSLAVSSDFRSDPANNNELYGLFTVQDRSTFTFRCALLGPVGNNRLPDDYGSIEPVFFTNDGKYVVGGTFVYIYIWETNSCRLVNTLIDNEKWGGDRSNFVNSIAYSPDGQWLASSHVDGSLKIWSLPDGVLYGSFLNYPEQVHNKLLFLPDGRLLSSLGSIWSVPEGTKIGEDPNFSGYPHTISNNGKYLATSYNDEVRIVEVDTGEIVFRRTMYSLLHDPEIAFSPDMTMFIINQTGIIEIWGEPK
ncbi:MAG TPA: hypothetical protein DCY14_13130 [Anaerolineae bacterium]|nr:hypothetical protein [Anaerolineae bacterium]HRJ58860.1 hypothetical protein [Anaerolineales bacterium]